MRSRSNLHATQAGPAGLQHRVAYRLEGRVYIGFVVETDGSVAEACVQRGIGDGCDEAARAAADAARFVPGHQRGRPVRVRMSLPVTFRVR